MLKRTGHNTWVSVNNKEESASHGDKKLLLFTTKTCPNCKIAKNILDKAGISYTVVDAEEQTDIADKLGIRQAPTLAILDGGQVSLYGNASNIKKFAESYR